MDLSGIRGVCAINSFRFLVSARNIDSDFDFDYDFEFVFDVVIRFDFNALIFSFINIIIAGTFARAII